MVIGVIQYIYTELLLRDFSHLSEWKDDLAVISGELTFRIVSPDYTHHDRVSRSVCVNTLVNLLFQLLCWITSCDPVVCQAEYRCPLYIRPQDVQIDVPKLLHFLLLPLSSVQNTHMVIFSSGGCCFKTQYSTFLCLFCPFIQCQTTTPPSHQARGVELTYSQCPFDHPRRHFVVNFLLVGLVVFQPFPPPVDEHIAFFKPARGSTAIKTECSQLVSDDL